MDYLDVYMGWMEVDGDNHKDSFRNATKRQIRNYILNSPTRSEVKLLQLEEQPDKTYKVVPTETRTTLVSDKETFYKRTILFLPDEDVPLGSYMQYDNKIYLSTNISDVDVYPQSFVEYCNQTLTIKGESVKILVGHDSIGKPQHKTITPISEIPCVITSKIYSVLDNSQIPLPEGAIMVYIPYHDGIDVPINYEFNVHGDIYQVTTVNKINVLTDENGHKYGYLEIRGQRDVKK